jgi:hypothetical protein
MNQLTDEIQPFLVYRIAIQQMECALWQFKEGERAIALFLSEESASAYRASAKLGEDWKIFSPPKDVLLQLFKLSYQSGITRAVLEPDLVKAKRIFSLHDIVRAVEGPT